MPQKTIHPADEAAASTGFVVGIGASAGGLEAINDFFDNIPNDTGFSFVVIQHLSPDYKSLMAELLSKHTEMKVIEAVEGMELKPNSIYLIPTKKFLTLKRNQLQLHDKVRENLPNTTIDRFFESLAEEKGEKSVGIILSGTGSDGTKGIGAIKKKGGVIIVQDPSSAEFDGMPNSAISTGYADLILPPNAMGDELVSYLNEAPLLRSFTNLNNQEEAIIEDILEQVFRITQHDFSHYKRPTINRRLAKRMAEKGIKSLSEYYEHLTNHPDEVKLLCREFLINVTRFFRDKDAFEILKTNVIPLLFAAKQPGETIKVWVVATSTGEEAYSIAMLCEDYMQQHNKYDITVKIFATDIDQHAIEVASRGVYNEDVLKGVSAAQVKKYFVKEGNQFKVSAALRKLVVFAKHDITKDPPFSRIDLLSCRNMLIYMNSLLQKSILQKFHFALNEDGYLFLGNSENISVLKDVMQEVDKKWKIYKCINKLKTGDYETFINPVEKPYFQLPAPKAKNALSHLAEIFKDTLLDEYQFAGIFIDREFEVKQAVGAFKNFLNFPEDNFNFNLLKLVPPDLSVALSTCVRKSIKENEKVVQKKIKVNDGKRERFINIVVKPFLTQKTYLQPFLFIILNEVEVDRKKYSHDSNSPRNKEASTEKLAELEQELKDTKENLQAVIEEIESANEELQSSNEEIISANEELQSTNEELQSLNEELHTVNAEHQLKIRELIDLNDDLNNYFNNSEVGQILIDKNLVIRKFTPFAKKQINLIESDIGRSITDISTNFHDKSFIDDIKNVMSGRERFEQDILMRDGSVFLMRIAPFVRQDKSIDGVVINFIDISQIKTLSSIIEAVLNSSTNGILAQTAIRNEQNEIVDFRFITVNKAAETMLHVPHGSLLGKTLKESFPQFNTHFGLYAQVVETGRIMQLEYYFEERQRWYDIVCVKMMDGIVTTFSDITERKKAADLLALGFEELKVTTKKLEKSNMDLLQFASVASHDLKEPLRKIQAFGNLLKERVKDKLEVSEFRYIDKMIHSSNRMQNLVDDILTLSRLSNTDIPYKEVDLNDIVYKIMDDLEITIKEKKAKLEVSELPVIRAVPGQMHQLFLNLISNALKFTDKEQPLITIREKVLPESLRKEYNLDDHPYHYVEVIDDGIGFEQKYADKIFGIFQRLDGNAYQGSGIGLAICKKIVENHKGHIKVQSKPGNGSKFMLLLPQNK